MSFNGAGISTAALDMAYCSFVTPLKQEVKAQHKTASIPNEHKLYKAWCDFIVVLNIDIRDEKYNIQAKFFLH